MDPLTHFLTGGCLGRAGFNRKSALVTATMVLAAEAADLDVLWGFKGSIAELQHHRGITHSFVGVPFVAAAVWLFMYGLHWLRQQRPRGKPHAQPVRWGYLYFVALVAAASHLLLDYTTSYGIRLFEPFNYRWYTWDIMYILDPVIWAVLIAGLALPSLAGLINQEIGVRRKGPRGRVGAIIALLCMVATWGVRDFQHRRAVNLLNSFLYQGEAPQRVGAYPYMIDIFRWHGVVETTDLFETVPVNSGLAKVDEDSAVVFYKPPETEVTQAAKASYLGRVYLDWAVFPFVRAQTLEGETPGYLVSFQDLRYTYPEARGRRVPLGAFVLLSPQLQVLDEGMNMRKSPSIENLEHPPGQR